MKQENISKLKDYLINRSSWVTASELASYLHTTPRTVQNYIREINRQKKDLIISSQNGYLFNPGEVKENDIPDIIVRFHNLEEERDRERTEQSFMVPKEEIVDNGYDLSINKYKKIEYIPVEYPPTEEILRNIDELESQIQVELEELKKLLETN